MMTDRPKTIVDPERMKRVVEQTVQRLRTEPQFLGVVQQAIAAAHDRDPNLAATNVALILVQCEQLAREAVVAKLKGEITEDEDLEVVATDLEPGLKFAIDRVQKLCDDFGTVRILRATKAPPTNGPGRLET